jgi:hypothetical protein
VGSVADRRRAGRQPFDIPGATGFLLMLGMRAYGEFRNDKSERCLAVLNASTADQASLIQLPCNGHADQRWRTDIKLVLPGGEYAAGPCARPARRHRRGRRPVPVAVTRPYIPRSARGPDALPAPVPSDHGPSADRISNILPDGGAIHGSRGVPRVLARDAAEPTGHPS